MVHSISGITKKLLPAALTLFCLTARADEGMWMINAVNSALEKKMQERGLCLSAKEIYNADSEGTTLSDAVVSMEFGCTGSIISDFGLLITNHHCAYSDIHALSTGEHNYLEDGFWAMQSSEEIPIKGKSVLFLKRVLDVTEEVEDFIKEQKSSGKPYGMRKISYLLEKKYKSEYGYEAILSSMWSGSKYYMSLYTVYKDVRLVAAPPVSCAAFGGDIDNWEWPQHKCDFAMYRIYTAPDGSPAGYAPENVPLKPKAKLDISLDGYKPGDFTMVIGYPGRTDRYSSSYKTDFLERVSLPISNGLRGKQMEIINRHMSSDPETRLKYSDYYFSLSNVQELNEGEVLCFKRFGVKEKRREQERELREWIDSDASRKEEWGNMLRLTEEKYASAEKVRKDMTYYRETLVRGTRIGIIAGRLNGLKGEILKAHGITPRRTLDNLPPDSAEVRCCRFCRFKGKECNAIQRSITEYDRISLDVEKDLFVFAVNGFYRNVDSIWFGPYQKKLLKDFTDSRGVTDWSALTESVWSGSFLTDSRKFKEFINSDHSVNEYLSDPLYRFFTDVRMADFNKRLTEIEGEPDINTLEKDYVHALYQMRKDKGIEQYPNANSTMRITYGTVGPIEPYDAVLCSWQSTAGGILEKHNPDSYEFSLKERHKKLLESGDWGVWGIRKQGCGKDRKHSCRSESQMPIDFLTDNDITGGNSGSPVLNARGKLIGLAFDGNKESLASDAQYVGGYNKCVCVDIRYILWTLDRYAGMSRIIEELGL